LYFLLFDGAQALQVGAELTINLAGSKQPLLVRAAYQFASTPLVIFILE
jgi:hypothetical protein